MTDAQRTKQEKEILDDIRSGEDKRMTIALQKLQTSFWVKMAHAAVSSRGGTVEEADDIFYDSIGDLVMNILENKFKENSRLSTYFYGICDKKMLSMLSKREKLVLTTDIEHARHSETENEAEQNWVEKDEKKRRKALVDEVLELVGYPCNQIMIFDSMGFRNEVIAIRIGFKTADSVKSKLYNCRKKLRTIIESNPLRYKI